MCAAVGAAAVNGNSDETISGVCNNDDKKTNILLGVTGSVAAVKAPEIAVRLAVEHGARVR